MAKGKRRKKHYGRVIVSLVLIAVAIGLFLGRNAVINGLKSKFTEVIAKKIIEEQFRSEKESGVLDIDDETVSKVIESIEPEDLQEAADIAEKYIEPENIGEYVDMVKEGNLSELEQQFQDQVSMEDQQRLMELYEKYKDQIPQGIMPEP